MDRHELQRRRRALGLSQVELAKLLGVYQATISRWEDGKVVIRHPRILDWALTGSEKARAWGDTREGMAASKQERGDGGGEIPGDDQFVGVGQ